LFSVVALVAFVVVLKVIVWYWDLLLFALGAFVVADIEAIVLGFVVGIVVIQFESNCFVFGFVVVALVAFVVVELVAFVIVAMVAFVVVDIESLCLVLGFVVVALGASSCCW